MVQKQITVIYDDENGEKIMSYTTKHKPYKLKSVKCNGCGWSISHCMDLKKEQLRIKSLKKEVVKEYIHVDNPKCKHCIELEKKEK